MIESLALFTVLLVLVAGLAFAIWRQIRASLGVRRRSNGAARPANRAVREAPTVTVQLPLYNEPRVAPDLLRAIAAFDYPLDRLDIQVLDDSTDTTPEILAPEIDRLRERGITIAHIRRAVRDGWKAGALAEGLRRSRAEFVAIFDADFTPPPDFLRRALIESDAFDDPKVAFLQGRWTYANAGENLVTRAQALLLDWQFFVQKPSMMAQGLRTMFHGSGGIWRRSAIDAVGGWSGETLAEDLDLSLRTVLSGRTSVFDATLTCPSEIPSTLLAFRLQQRRWAKGTAQCLRAFAGRCLGASDPTLRRTFLAAAGLAVYPLLLAAFLLWPAIALSATPWPLQALCLLGLMAVLVTLLSGQTATIVASGRPLSLTSALDAVLATALVLGSLPNSTIAFLSGLFGGPSVFERTPKAGHNPPLLSADAPMAPPLHGSIALDGIVAAGMLLSSVALIWEGQFLSALPCLILGACVARVVHGQISDFRSVTRRPG